MIRIEDLSVAFGGTEVVKHVSLEIRDGEILGIVGESGSGKSVTALTLMGLVSDAADMTAGRILFDDVVLREAGKPCDRALYRRYQGAEMSQVFQEPQTSLNPTRKAGKQVEEVLRLHTKLTGEEIRTRVLETFRAVGLHEAERVYDSYPVVWKNKSAKPKLCFMGCPHMSLEQLTTWTQRVEQGLRASGKKKVVIPTVFTAAPAVIRAFEATPYGERLKRTGVVLSYICPLMYMNNPLSGKMPVITSSNKLRTYTTARYYTDDEILDQIMKGGN